MPPAKPLGNLTVRLQRILFLIPYFGRWPFWMPFFLASCRHNSNIDWLFFTDCGVPDDAPDNVRFESCSFTEYCHYVSLRLGINFQPLSPYKLCDLKPALGYIHSDVLNGYDFWGFGDIDLVYGDLRSYFTTERLHFFDLLSTHERRVSGHLCLLRCSKKMLELFMSVPEWETRLAAREHNCFDESAFSKLFIKHKNWPALLRLCAGLFNPLRRRSEFVEAFSTPNGHVYWHNKSFNFPSRWIWRNGHLFNDQDGEREFPYFHFMVWKTDAWPRHNECDLVQSPFLADSSEWAITPYGFREA